MPVRVPSGLSDDNDFTEIVDSVVRHLLAQQQPDELWIIQIDNWFDHKWLRFSGNGIAANWMFANTIPGDFLAARFDSVKKPHIQTKVTFPPFSPQRILGQWSFQRSGSDYAEFALLAIPHHTEKRRSAANLHRRIADFSKSACIVWFSGNTLKNDRGSLMVYQISESEIECWYASFQRTDAWVVSKAKGIDLDAVQRLMARG